MNIDKQLKSARDRLKNAQTMADRVPIQKQINKLLQMKEDKKNNNK